MVLTSDAKMKIKRIDSDSSGVKLDPKELDDFLHIMRRKFRDKINREGDILHDLLAYLVRSTIYLTFFH